MTSLRRSAAWRKRRAAASEAGAPEAAAPRPRPRHLSLLRDFQLADWFTLGNAACGMGAVLLAMAFMGRGERALFLASAALAPLAFAFDALDGRIARRRQAHSALGRELDSLADVISFGVAPAALGFAAGLQGGWDVLLLIYFVACGVGRLARYNVSAEQLAGATGKVAYFEGTPIPTSIAITALLAAAGSMGALGERLWGGAWQLGPWLLHPLALVYGLSGTLMVSKTLRIPKP